MPWAKISRIFGTGRPTNFKLGVRTEYDDPHHRHAQWLQKSKVKVIASRCQLDACLSITRQWKSHKHRHWHEGCTWHGWHRTPVPRSKVKGQGHQTDKCRDRKSVVFSEREGLQTSNLVYWWSTMTRISYVRGDLQPENFGWLFKSPFAGGGGILWPATRGRIACFDAVTVKFAVRNCR